MISTQACLNVVVSTFFTFLRSECERANFKGLGDSGGLTRMLQRCGIFENDNLQCKHLQSNNTTMTRFSHFLRFVPDHRGELVSHPRLLLSHCSRWRILLHNQLAQLLRVVQPSRSGLDLLKWMGKCNRASQVEQVEDEPCNLKSEEQLLINNIEKKTY
jgi:hypothetical protein